jgi:RND family efflux transporter MFP subunit
MKSVVACLSIAGAAVCLSSCREVHGETQPAPRPVKVMEVREADAPARTRYAVTIQAYEQIPLAFKASGYIDAVLQRRGADGRLRAVQPGDAVSRDAVLARVREADYRERLNQATAAEAELEAAHSKAIADLERARTLFAADALTRPDLDAAQTAYDANVARLSSSHAQIEMARISLGDTALVAPRSGIILDRKIEIGSLVGAGSVGFVVADISSVKAVFGVPDSLVPRLSLGQPLAIVTEAFRGRTFHGRVTALSPSADAQSRVFDVEVTMANPDLQLRPGMIGAVEITTNPPAAETDASGPSVPLSAIVRAANDPNQYAVFALAGDGDAPTVRAQSVTLGAMRGNFVSITSGLRPGERVVVMGATLLTDGEAVRVIP